MAVAHAPALRHASQLLRPLAGNEAAVEMIFDHLGDVLTSLIGVFEVIKEVL
jgi:hypothetical protein